MSYRTATLLVFTALAMVLLAFTPFSARAQEEGESPEEIIARQEYMMNLRAGGPGRTIPPEAYSQMVARHLLVTPDTRIFGSTTASTNWTSVNPSGLVYKVTNNNFISGRTNSIAFHPTDPLTFYIASAGGGVWKTIDGGTSFQALTDNLTSLACGAVAVDPVNPSVVYLGTGELNYSLDSYYGDGVFKSTDAGASWTKIATTAAVGSYISQISINPLNTNTVYLSGSLGVFKSTNAGVSWTNTSSGTQANCILVNPLNPLYLYTTTGGYTSDVVKKSTDGGATWVPITSGLPASIARTQLALAASDTTILYASVANPSGYALLGLYASTNGGGSWTLKSSTNYLGGQGWYDNAITVKLSSSSTVIAGGLDIFSSTASGASLTQRTFWNTATSTSFSHADIHFLGYNGSVLYCGSDGGVFKSTNDGVSWTDLNATLSTLQYMSADYDPTSLLKLYGGTQDNNKESSTDGGTTWNQVTTGDGGYTVVDPVNTNFIYGQYVQGSCQRSSNSGASYTEIRPSASTGGLFYNPYAMAPGDHNTIVYGQSDLWRTTSAQSATSSSLWTRIATTTTVSGNVSSIAIGATNSGKIYAGTSGGRLLATPDTGTTWTTTTGFPYATGLAVDITNDNVCYASFSAFTGVHVAKTTDGGTTWSNVTGNFPNIPVLCIALRTAAPRTIFLGTDLGVYKSTDDGSTWASFNNGMPTLAVFDLKYKEGTQILLAATHGRGCWTFNYGVFLPIELASFTAAPGIGSGTHISWKTLSEINNYGFEVQRSTAVPDGFSTLQGGFVKGHGTTLTPQSYAFDDASVQPGSWYYRLKQIDLSGAVHYNEPVRVETTQGAASGGSAPPQFALLQNHPNPFNPSTTIRFDLAADRDVSLKVYNSLGQVVSELVGGHRPAGRYSIAWDASGFASGVYFYRLEAGNFVQTRKLIVLK